MSFFLSDKEHSRYLEDGFLVRPNQFVSEELENLRDIFEATVLKAHSVSDSGKEYFLDKKKFVDIDYLTLQYEPDPYSQYLKVIEPAHFLNNELDTVIADKRLTDPIKSILSVDNLSLWTD